LRLSFVIIPAALPANSNPDTPSITVRTYNLAKAPLKELMRASQAAGDIFKQAGIEVRWLSCASRLRRREQMGCAKKP